MLADRLMREMWGNQEAPLSCLHASISYTFTGTVKSDLNIHLCFILQLTLQESEQGFWALLQLY